MFQGLDPTPTLPKEAKAKEEKGDGEPKKSKRSFVADDGIKYRWSEAVNDWEEAGSGEWWWLCQSLFISNPSPLDKAFAVAILMSPMYPNQVMRVRWMRKRMRMVRQRKKMMKGRVRPRRRRRREDKNKQG